jgi:hypothetical protein
MPAEQAGRNDGGNQPSQNNLTDENATIKTAALINPVAAQQLSVPERTVAGIRIPSPRWAELVPPYVDSGQFRHTVVAV